MESINGPMRSQRVGHDWASEQPCKVFVKCSLWELNEHLIYSHYCCDYFLKKIFFKVWLGPICFYLFLKFYFGCAGSLLWHTGFASWVPGLSCPEVCGILVPWSGIEPMSPAMEGGFLTPGPPRKSPAMMMSKLRKKMTTGTFPCSIGETEVGEDLEHLGRSSQGTQWEGHELSEEGSRLPLCRVYLRVDPVSHGKEPKPLGNWERSCW